MKFKPVELQNYKGYRETKIQRFLNEFAKANIVIAEVILEEGEYKNATSAYSAVNNAIKRFKMQNISIRVADKKLYLINKVLYEKALQTEIKEE